MSDYIPASNPTSKKVKLTRSGAPDGRRHNATPEQTRIKPREVRNPHGRGGKPKVPTITSADEVFLSQASRIVTHDGKRPISAFERLVFGDMHAALTLRDDKAIDRLYKGVVAASDRKARSDANLLINVARYVDEYNDEFRRNKRMGYRAPDVLPHPAHVAIRDGEVVFTGPMTYESRAWWENLKAGIHCVARMQAVYREAVAAFPCSAVYAQLLKQAEIDRRRIMRKVPKGWNWRERIFTRDCQWHKVEEAFVGLERQRNRIKDECAERKKTGHCRQSLSVARTLPLRGDCCRGPLS